MHAGPVLLEPCMSLEIIAPEEFVGDAISDVHSRRGQVFGMEPRKNMSVVKGEAPLAGLFGYATALRSISQGRATYTMQFRGYDVVPPSVAKEIIARITG